MRLRLHYWCVPLGRALEQIEVPLEASGLRSDMSRMYIRILSWVNHALKADDAIFLTSRTATSLSYDTTTRNVHLEGSLLCYIKMKNIGEDIWLRRFQLTEFTDSFTDHNVYNFQHSGTSIYFYFILFSPFRTGWSIDLCTFGTRNRVYSPRDSRLRMPRRWRASFVSTSRHPTFACCSRKFAVPVDGVHPK